MRKRKGQIYLIGFYMDKKVNLSKEKNSTTLRVRKLSPTLLLTKPSVPYLSCSDEKEIFKLGVAVPTVKIESANLI